MDEAASASQIRPLCLQWLARRDYSQQELLAKLAGRGFAYDHSAAVIAELARQGWQSDRRYAENYARSRIRKGYGPNAIACGLNRHGIADVDLDGLAEAEAGCWQNLLMQVYQKKYPEPARAAKEWAKRGRFLLQRGFPAAMIKSLFNEVRQGHVLGRDDASF